MKKTSSLVWRFFDRLEDNKRCVAVLCKLCDSQYKYFGNTTNLRTHLTNKHPIQWDLLQNGTLDESTFRAFDDEENNQSSVAPKRKRYVKAYKDDNVRYSVSIDNKGNNRDPSAQNSMPVIEIQRVDVLEAGETDNELHGEAQEPISVVRQMHSNRASDEEWLNEEIYEAVDYQPRRKKTKYRPIKRELHSPPLVTHNTPKYRVIQNSNPYARSERIIYDDSLKKDEFAVFGEYVGNRMRKFQNPQVRGNVQQLIATILWQAEYGMYDNIETVKRVMLHSVQDMEVEQIIVQEGETHAHNKAEPVVDNN